MAIWKGLGVQEHERTQVLRLMFHLAMSALLATFGASLVSGNLLSRLPARFIPWVFLLIPAVALPLALLLPRWIQGVPARRLAVIYLGSVLVAGSSLFESPTPFLPVSLGGLFPFVGFWILFSLEMGQMSQYLDSCLNSWQKKRLLGLILSVGKIGGILGGLAPGFVIPLLGEGKSLFLWGLSLSILGVLAGLNLLGMAQNKVQPGRRPASFRQIRSHRLSSGLAALVLGDVFMGAAVIYLFNTGLSLNFAQDASGLATFLGQLTAGAHLLMLFFQAFLMSFLQRKLGSLNLLMVCPMLGIAAALVALDQIPLALVAALILLKDHLIPVFNGPNRLILVQGLPASIRSQALSFLEGVIPQASAFGSGLLLLVIAHAFGGNSEVLIQALALLILVFGAFQLVIVKILGPLFQYSLEESILLASYQGVMSRNPVSLEKWDEISQQEDEELLKVFLSKQDLGAEELREFGLRVSGKARLLVYETCQQRGLSIFEGERPSSPAEISPAAAVAVVEGRDSETLKSWESNLEKYTEEEAELFFRCTRLLRFPLSPDSVQIILSRGMHFSPNLRERAFLALSLIPSRDWLMGLFPYLGSRSQGMRKFLKGVLAEALRGDGTLRRWFLKEARTRMKCLEEWHFLFELCEALGQDALEDFRLIAPDAEQFCIILLERLGTLSGNGHREELLYELLEEELRHGLRLYLNIGLIPESPGLRFRIREGLFGMGSRRCFEALELLHSLGYRELAGVLAPYFEGVEPKGVLKSWGKIMRIQGLEQCLEECLHSEDEQLRAAALLHLMNNPHPRFMEMVSCISEKSEDMYTQEMALRCLVVWKETC